MDNKPTAENKNKGSFGIKQTFLSSAISDISTYIQLADTKVSIIMAAVVAMIVGAFTCHQIIADAVDPIKPCSWLGVSLIILTTLLIVCIIGVFVSGILTIRGHSSKIAYQSKWFLPQSTSEYSFDTFKKDVLDMNDDAVIENMAAELYKLNDINRQKLRTNKWTIRCFSASLICSFLICILLILSKL